jgi:hypothetical protein
MKACAWIALVLAVVGVLASLVRGSAMAFVYGVFGGHAMHMILTRWSTWFSGMPAILLAVAVLILIKKTQEAQAIGGVPKRPAKASPSYFPFVLVTGGVFLFVVLFYVLSSVERKKPPAWRPEQAAMPAAQDEPQQEQSQPARKPLTDQEHNAIWWAVERSTGKVADALVARWSEKGNRSVEDFAADIERKIRRPIAEEYGITCDDLKRIFAEGKTAAWRTKESP